jgi:hypothetical protein
MSAFLLFLRVYQNKDVRTPHFPEPHIRNNGVSFMFHIHQSGLRKTQP